MKRFLAKLGAPRTIGLFIGEREVALSHVAGTLLGPIELDQERATYAQADQLPEVLERLLGQHPSRSANVALPVALGIPPERIFFSTRPIRTDNNTASPGVLLHEALQSSALSADEMVVDVIEARPEQRKIACIAACRKKYLLSLAGQSLERRGGQLIRAEPAPCALLRAATDHHPAPRRARTVLRIFLGEESGLAVVVSAQLPLLWRTFGFPPGQQPILSDAADPRVESQRPLPADPTGLSKDVEESEKGAMQECEEESAAIRSVIRSLQTVIVHCGVEPTLDAILIHGRADLHSGLEKNLAEEGGVHPQLYAEPGLSTRWIAYGLALGGLRGLGGWSRWHDGFDLASTLKPPARLRDLIPWGDLITQFCMLALWALFLLYRLQSLDHDYRKVQRETQSVLTTLGTPSGADKGGDGWTEGKLRSEKQELTGKVEAVQRFLSTRAYWTVHTQEVAVRLPVAPTLHSFQGTCDLEDAASKKASGKAKKGVIVRASAPIATGKSVPQEIDRFFDLVKSCTTLTA